MKIPRRILSWIAAAVLLCGFGTALMAGSSRVTLLRTPDGGIQPQAAVDSQGTVHMIYYKGDPGGGDIFYVRSRAADKEFSKPIRVNSQSGSAMATGTIRGAQMAVGQDGRVHVAWDGMGKGARRVVFREKEVTPFLYTRLNEEGTAFDPERNLITYAYGLDGGGSIAADRQGNVYAFWHAPKPGNTKGELGRAVFVAHSNDSGKTFAPETLATSQPTGACGCCGMKAFADSEGNVFALFRAASETGTRDETLLVSRHQGSNFEIAYSHAWKIATCPMSSAFLSESKSGVLAAAETHKKVFFVRFDPRTGKVSKPILPSGENQRKHPVAISNDRGETLFVWTEGTAWAKGGSVAWQMFDKNDDATSEQGAAEGVAVWSLPTAYAKRDGNFVIVY